MLPPSPTNSLREVTVPLKDSNATIPEINRLLPRADPPCASQIGKHDSDRVMQRQDAHLKHYVFDKFPLSEENL